MPIYPNRLLHTACQLPDQKNELFNQCFLTMSFDIEDLTISFKEKKPFCFVKSVHGSFKNLIQPNLWEDNVQQKIFKLKVGAIDFTANSVQLFTIMSISKSLICHDVEYIIDLDDVTLMKSIDVDDRVTMQIILKSIDLTYAETSTTRFGKVNLKKISGFAFHPKSAKKKSLMVNWPDITGMANLKDYESVLLVTVQFPKDHVAKNAPLVSVLFSDGAIRFDPMLQEFFKWEFLKRNDKKGKKNN